MDDNMNKISVNRIVNQKTKDNAMKKRLIDIFLIILIAISLMTLESFNLLEKSAKFMVVPIMGFYFLGWFVERRFQKK